MRVKNLVVAVAILTSAGAVLASDETVSPEVGFIPTKTRAAVIEELSQAQTAGVLVGNDSYVPLSDMTARMKTRSEVAAELWQARKNGSLNFNDSQYPDSGVADASRSQTESRVVAEADSKQSAPSKDNQDSIYLG